MIELPPTQHSIDIIALDEASAYSPVQLPRCHPACGRFDRFEPSTHYRVRDVFVPEVLLDRVGVLALARELVATGMPQPVRMDQEGELHEARRRV